MSASSASQVALQGKSFKYGMPIYGLAWPDGDVIYVCGGGGMGIKNRLVCAESRRGQLTDQVAEWVFGEDCPMRMALTPNGKSLVFAMGQGGIRRLDQDTKGRFPKFVSMTGDLQDRLSSIRGEVKCLCFRPSGTHLALGFGNGEVVVYEWPSLKEKMSRSGDKKLSDGIRDLAFSLPPISSSTSSTPSTSTQGAAASTSTGAPGSSGGPGAQRSMHMLAVVLDNGTCELWDWEAETMTCRMEPGKMKQKLERTIVLSAEGLTTVQQLPKGTERVQVARVHWARDGSGDLLTLLNGPGGAHVARWAGAASPPPPPTPIAVSSATSPSAPPTANTSQPAAESSSGGAAAAASSIAPALPRLVLCKRVSEDPCTCFDVSADGSMLAFGTSEGGVLVTSAAACAPLRMIPKAHMVFATGIVFSPTGKYVLSTSADASARITDVSRAGGRAAEADAGGRPGSKGWARVLKLVILLIAILLTCALQAVRVLKRNYGMSNQQIKGMVLGWVGLEGKDEL